MTRVQVLSVGSGLAGGEEPIPVTAMVYYNGSAQNYTLRIGVFEAESPLQAVPGIVSSSTDACMTPETAVALCTIPIHAVYGREQISFKIGGIFGEQHMPGPWKLEMTAAFYEAMGDAASHRAFATMTEGTHHNDFGSYEVAKCVLMGLKQNKLDLAKDIVDDFTGFDPAHPDSVDAFTLPKNTGRSAPTPLGN